MPLPFRLAITFCVLPILLSVPASASEPRFASGVAHIGDLELRFDPSTWTTDGGGDRFTITCNAPECRGTTIVATVATEAEAPCTSATPARMLEASPDALGPGEPPEGATFSVNGLTVHWVEAYLGCRNWAGGPVAACTSHAGKTYRFEALGNACRTPPSYARTVLGVLMGLRAR